MNGLLTVWSNSSSRRLSADLRELIAAGLGETSFLSKCSPYSCTETTHHNRATDHSLANKTVVQLRPKSTIGSSFFLLEYIWDFCRRVWSITWNFFPFRVSVWVNVIVCVHLCLILVWFCYINDFAGADTGTSLLYCNTVRLEGYVHGSYWLTCVHCSHYKCIVTQNA